MAHQGRMLFQRLNCIQCHDTEQSKAPPLEGIYKQKRAIRNGGNIEATDQYLKDSIRNPRKHVREGWEPIMPAFGQDKVSDDDLNNVVAYIKSLRKGETPVRTDKAPPPVGGLTEPLPAGKTTTGGGPK